MRIVLLMICFSVAVTVLGQGVGDKGNSDGANVHGKQLAQFLDSLKNKILRDTVRYRTTDLIFTAGGRRNTNSYSNLYIVNGSYIYKLDIINGAGVLEFVNEVLDSKKIKHVSWMEGAKASEHFGRNAWNGLVLITLLDTVQFEPRIAGLVLNDDKSGDNFSKRKENELLIQD